ncbi:DMT family transporter [Microbacterium sediminicola]|uniref:DMT family transporter n=1 Tax=Microbacterium sediminicola TaxID=415210 RepID=A0ABP4U7H0_9MICO
MAQTAAAGLIAARGVALGQNEPVRSGTATTILALSGTIAVGALTAMQVRVNGQLGHRIEDSTVAAAVSFGSGLIIVAFIALITRAGRQGARVLVDGIRVRRIPWWMLLGGLAGAFTVSSQSITAGIIGVALFTVGFVAGQIVFGIVIDRIGYSPSGVVPVTMRRVLGGAIALVAVAVSVTGSHLAEVPWWMLLLPFASGAGVSWQQATNGRLRQQTDSAMIATVINFLGGTAVLVPIAIVHVALFGFPVVWPDDPWPYLGGALGVVYIMLSAALVRRTGVLLLVLGSVVGQLIAALILDALWPTPASPGFVRELVIAGLALVSVLVVVVPRRPRTA